MPENTPAIPPPEGDEQPRPSLNETPSVRVNRIRAEAFVDFFVVGCFTYLLTAKIVTDPTMMWALLGAMATIAGVGGWMKNAGKSGSAVMLMAKPVAHVVVAVVGAKS